MIRFIKLGRQYWGGGDENREHFAYIDTVVDKFVQVNGEHFWDCWEDFVEDYNSLGRGWREIPLERFKSLTAKIFFRAHED